MPDRAPRRIANRTKVKLRPTRLRTELPRGGNTPKMGRLSKEDRLSQADPEQR